MIIREATGSDLESAAEVSRLAFEPLRQIYRPTAKALANKARLNRQGMPRLIAELDGVTVGTVEYHIEGNRLSVIGLAVRPDYQRRGVARALIKRLASVAASGSLYALSLHTVRQTGNVAIFARLGFQVIHEEPDEFSESVHGGPLMDTTMERPVDL